MNQDSRLQELLDREAIRQLVNRYFHYARTKNSQGIVEMFAPDAVFDIPVNLVPGGVHAGRAAIAELYRDVLDRLDPRPFGHNHVVEITAEDRAKGTLHVELRLGSKNLRTTNIGVYEDEYVKMGEEWKFQSRKLSMEAVP